MMSRSTPFRRRTPLRRSTRCLGLPAVVGALAICMFFGLVDRAAAVTSARENISRYTERQLDWGATTLEIPARLEYAAARAEIARGNMEEAEVHLERATALSPNWPDPYFTRSLLNFRSFRPDALFFFVGGLRAASNNFHFQSLLAVNLLLYAVLLLIALTTVACTAFSLRYLPFAAYRLAESLRGRFGAIFPRTSAVLILLVPFALFPGFVTGFAFFVLLTWYFMQRREKVLVFVLALPFAALSFFAPVVERITPGVDPSSLSSLTSRAGHSPGSGLLVKRVEAVSPPGLDAEQNVVAGILLTREENYDAAASHFLEAIALHPDDAVAYINLGNVYFRQGLYEKALEGYRKAERLAPSDAVGQYNLAQAYIKTLLLAESSQALKNAAANGVEGVKASFGEGALERAQVYTRAFTPVEMWRIATTEGRWRPGLTVNTVFRPLTGFPVRTGGWIMLASVMLAMFIGRFLKQRRLAFQCSNCGDLTSESTCNSERGTFICAPCAESIENVSSDKVVEALLRQRRQKVLVRRRHAIRILTLWIPGVRDFYYGRVTRGIILSGAFAVAAVFLKTGGYLVRDWEILQSDLPLWKLVLPAAVIVATYALSFFSRHYYEVRNYRTPGLGSATAAQRDPATRRRSA